MWSKGMEREIKRAEVPAGQGAAVERQQLLEAMAERHPLPGFYPVVVIGAAGDGFRVALLAHLDAHAGVGEVRFSERLSSRGAYVSYHLQLWVEDAESALVAKESLALLEGVLALF